MAEGIKYYPKQFDLGWIFYDDNNNSSYDENGYWEHIRKIGRDDANRALSNFCQSFTGETLREKMGEYAQSLKNMSLIERAKENKIMFEFTGQDFSSEIGKNFLRHFNEIVQGQEKFSAALNRVIAAIELGGKQRAPSQSVNFVSYFRSEFNTILERYSAEQLLDDSIWDSLVKEVTNIAIDRMTTDFDPTKEIFGNASDYEGLNQYLKSNPLFYEFVKSYLKIDDIKKEAQNIASKKKKKRGKEIKINDVYKIQTTDKKTGKTSFKSNELYERMVGGLVQEFFSAGTIQIALTEAGAQVISNSLRSNIGATDTITVASLQKDISFINDIEEQIQQAVFGETQKEIAQHFKELDNKLNRKKYSDLFVIHGSDKLYSMGDSFRSFAKTQKITDIQYLLDKAELGGSRFGHELVSLYLNTTPGAVLADAKETIHNSLRVIVAAIAGNLLFSDWVMIGQESGGATQIHIFDLDGIMIPLSYVLEGLALAMERFSEVGIYQGPLTISSFETPAGILYPKNRSDRYGLGNTKKIVDFNEFWNRQREDARAKSQFRISFMSDFKQIVGDIAATF